MNNFSNYILYINYNKSWGPKRFSITDKSIIIYNRGIRTPKIRGAMAPWPSLSSASDDDRKHFCQFIKEVRLPDDFLSNFKKRVVAHDSNITGLMSHDFHILMQRLLPIGVHVFLDKDTSTTIIKLCTFFIKKLFKNHKC